MSLSKEMARIGYTDDGFEVYVNTDDGGNIPHFHYRVKGSWDNHTCIKLDKPEYFHHDGKESLLNSKQRKNLIQFLNRFDDEEGKTNWQILVIEWNRNNSNKKVDRNIPMPDYTKLQ